jgi:hypothetical protein
VGSENAHGWAFDFFLERCHKDGDEFLSHIVRVTGDEPCFRLWMLKPKSSQSSGCTHIHQTSPKSLRGLSESSRTVIVVTASVKEDERGGQGHTSANLQHHSATWHRAVSTHCFYTSAFSTLCFVLSAVDGKIEQRVCHVTPRCEHSLFLHECFFDFVFRFICSGW